MNIDEDLDALQRAKARLDRLDLAAERPTGGEHDAGCNTGEHGHEAILDLSGVSFIDSTALRLVWDVNAEAQNDGTELTLYDLHPVVPRFRRRTQAQFSLARAQFLRRADGDAESGGALRLLAAPQHFVAGLSVPWQGLPELIGAGLITHLAAQVLHDATALGLDVGAGPLPDLLRLLFGLGEDVRTDAAPAIK